MDASVAGRTSGPGGLALVGVGGGGATTITARVRRGLGHRGRQALARARRRARRATAWARLRPTYLVIGAQKSGTTALHRYLARHPAVLTSVVKETEFFNRSYALGERSYRASFPLALRALAVRLRTGIWPAVGEATAAYLFDPRVPRRVHELNPRMMLIVILRDPVDRAYSHYQMELHWGRETLPFEEALEREKSEVARELALIAERPLESGDGFPCSYVSRGRYAEQLELWLRFFPREQLLVLTSDELRSDPADVLARVARFLRIPEHREPAYPLVSAREYEVMPPDLRERLARIFEADNRRLEELIGRPLPWTRPHVSAPAHSATS